ncbi:hypothetical protein FMM05_08935 [Flavobacterium zepuense]|uniref:Uncharacterized protein n=1 Tax=Flavobacterium zepuense TaxID=2593302 RepID=A0A552V2D6_9FLAO|nr:hypothetical protein [Flavobacterium zepuense]TRW24628.1 hypothetical protein FMM05_08935 [Flavobacterium zepuense]
MIVFTTLAEKDYFYGVAALVNSMVQNGTYGNKIVVGYRGALPNWLPQLSASKNGKSFTLKNGFEIDFVEVQGNLHMVHEKPKWFKHLTDVLEPGADEYIFFDSDIVVINRMSFFGEWVRQGVALCEDVNNDMGITHPIRLQWKKILKDKGYTITNDLDRYINSGFLGWTKDTKQFVTEWDDCFMILKEIAGDLTKFRVNDRTSVVLSANQDAFNLAAMVTQCQISIIGPEAMGFQYGLPLMVHPLGPKPWSRKFLSDFFNGNPPRASDVAFWEVVNSGEIKPYGDAYVSFKLKTIKFYRLLARFYRRL